MRLRSSYVLPVFFLVLLAGAMVLGPLLYFLLERVSPVPIPFHRAMDRALLISAVAAMVLVWPRLSFSRLWPWGAGAWQQLLLGYFMAAVTAQAIIGLDLALSGFTSAHRTGHEIFSRVFIALVAALLIPPLEETIFRGFLQVELGERFGWCAGWIGAALLFMLAHFLKIPPSLDGQPVHLGSGAAALWAALGPIGDGSFLSGRGLNLFLIGLILGGIFLRSGSLWLNAGLHSGWILVLLLFTGLTRPLEVPRVPFFAGDFLSTPITSLVLILAGLWLWRFYRHPSILPENGPDAP